MLGLGLAQTTSCTGVWPQAESSAMDVQLLETRFWSPPTPEKCLHGLNCEEKQNNPLKASEYGSIERHRRLTQLFLYHLTKKRILIFGAFFPPTIMFPLLGKSFQNKIPSSLVNNLDIWVSRYFFCFTQVCENIQATPFTSLDFILMCRFKSGPSFVCDACSLQNEWRSSQG